MKRFHRNLPAFLALILVTALSAPAGLLAQETAAASMPEEIIVNAPENLRNLRLEINRAQANLFNVFNDLNDDDKFDVHCRYVSRWQSKIREQVCTPVYLDIANEEEANIVLGQLGYIGGENGLPGVTKIEHYNGIFKEKVETVLQHPEFRQALEEYQFLNETLEEIRKSRFGSDE